MLQVLGIPFKPKVNGIQDVILSLPNCAKKSGDELRKYIGRKFKVWYVVEDPSFNQLLLDQPISDEGSEK